MSEQHREWGRKGGQSHKPRPKEFTPEMLKPYQGRAAVYQALALGCSRRTIYRLRQQTKEHQQ